MSFKKMKRDDLYALATENFGVEVSETANHTQIMAALAEMGVTWDMAKVYDKNASVIAEGEAEAERVLASQSNVITASQVKAVVVEPKVTVSDTAHGVSVELEAAPAVVIAPAAPEVILLKMERENPSYQIRGHKFTRENPFSLVGVDDASYILENIEGFKQASPREAKEFYG